MMEPLVEAALFSLDTLRRDLRAGLVGQSVETLNWRPYSGGNTIAGLLAHMLESSNYLLHLGLGETLSRERDAQFATTAPDTATLLARVDGSLTDLRQLAASFTPEQLAARRDFRGDDIPGAWFLVHICEHMLEHWGQIQTIRDLATHGSKV
jgi:uncharacterized damage-inducible protein DinB